jgi:hypothetical protein
MDNSDDSDDDSEDVAEIGGNYDALAKASRTTASHATFSAYESTHIVADNNNVSRRRTQQQLHGVQRRANDGPDGEYYVQSGRTRPNSYADKPEPHYSVTYSFMTMNGQQVTATTEYCYNPVPPLGATETILYDPESPTVGVTSEGRKEGMQIGGTLMLAFGLISVVIIGVCLFFVTRQTKRASNNSTNANTYSNDG